MDSGPIGFFDSGVGGLSILAEVGRLLPAERLIYVADTAFFPYGRQTADALCERAVLLTRFLLEHGAKLVVVACNTATVHALAHLRATFPAIVFVGVVPVIKTLAERTTTGVVGIMSTPNTARSTYLEDLIRKHAGGARVINMACDGLADLVEEGHIGGPRVKKRIDGFIQPMISAGVDAIGLGCTHYPFLRPLFENELPGNVRIYDSSAPVAMRVGNLLTIGDRLAGAPAAAPRLFATSDPERFSHVAQRLMPESEYAAIQAELARI